MSVGAAFSRLTHVPVKLHAQARNEVEGNGMTACKYLV
jgi:hypothetical protein